MDQENDDLANLETEQTETKLVRPDFIAEIPEIKTEADYEDTVGLQSATQGHTSTVAQRVAAACQITVCGKHVMTTPRGVCDDDVSATQSVVDLTDKHLFLSGLPTSVKQESVNEDLILYLRWRSVFSLARNG